MNHYQQLLDNVRYIAEAYKPAPRYNLFTVLRSESDEVRLHSRFLCSLISPDSHQNWEPVLRAFLEAIGIPWGQSGFSLTGVSVYPEKYNIDMLISNDRKQAVIVENKIYAGDQDKQLKRYHTKLRELGYKDIWLRYLTLDGSYPSADSLDGLDKKIAAPYWDCISYREEIRSWLTVAQKLVVDDVPVRESIDQYRSLVDRLTGNDKEKTYMDKVSEMLLNGDNLTWARDLTKAYDAALIHCHVELWEAVIKIIKTKYKDMAQARTVSGAYSGMSDDRNDIENVCTSYRTSLRNRKLPGISFECRRFWGVYVCAETGVSPYAGVVADENATRDDIAACSAILRQKIEHLNTDDSWIHWNYVIDKWNFTEPNEVTLKMLQSPDSLRKAAENIADEVYNLWEMLK